MPLIKNEVYKCEITGYTTEGLGVAKIDGQVVFIKNAVRNDILLIKIVKVNKKIAFGIIDTIITPSEFRCAPQCEVSLKCGGCELFNMTYEEELYFKKNKVYDAITRIAKIPLDSIEIFGSNDMLRYRNKAQYPVSFDGQNVVSGFYRQNSHDVVTTNDCLIQTEQSNQISNTICNFLTENNIKAYNEIDNDGTIRHIYIRTGFKTDEILVCLVSTTFNIKNIATLSNILKEQFPNIKSLVINKNSEKTNRILGSEYKTIFGDGVLSDILCDNKFIISPEAFYQVNRDSAEKLYNKAIEFSNFNDNETVLDMYCGVGTITLAVSKFVKEVIGVEIVEKAIVDANKNAEINNITNVKFICSDAKKASEDILKKGTKIDTIIVDPPRKGLDNDTINSIIQINPKKITYVSCDPATLARDIKIFSENGYYLQNACAFDLFPRTWHVETVILMTKA